MRIARLWPAPLWLAGAGLVAALPLAAQDPSANALLDRVRRHMVETLAQQPNYTCLETIERSSRGAREKDFHLEDVVKVEVALVDRREMFAWPGSKVFEDSDLRNFVPTGMFGNGDFGAFAQEVFAGLSTKFQMQGAEAVGPTITTRYDFQVPVNDGMRIQGQNREALSGYHGSFYADRETMDVLLLEVHADELPKDLDLREVTDSIEYARIKIGTGDFLLPAASEALMVSLRGDASRNHIRFSACREFTGQSKLIFSDNPDAAAGAEIAPGVKQEIRLPKNAEFTLRLVGDLDTDKAAVGDMVRAVLDNDVKTKGKVLLPKGTPVSGRIIRLERSSNFTVVGFVFQEAESDQVHATLDLTFQSAEGADVLGRGVRWGTRYPARPHEGLVPLHSGRVRLGRGFVLLWST
jgi:hypothetical protein